MNVDKLPRRQILTIDYDEQRHFLPGFPGFDHRFLYGMWGISMKELHHDVAVVVFRPEPGMAPRIVSQAIIDLRTPFPNAVTIVLSDDDRHFSESDLFLRNETTIAELDHFIPATLKTFHHRS